jgi:predicted transcriptional regulator of viral defense system
MYSLPGRNRDQIAEACLRVPQGVVCLPSALYFHGLIASKPQEIWMAIGSKVRLPRVDFLPLKIVRFSGDALTQGVVNSKIDGVPVRVYSPMKTIADCYKFRSKLGTEVARAALESSVAIGSYSRYRLLHFGRICRVEKLLDCSDITHQRPIRKRILPICLKQSSVQTPYSATRR